MQHNLCRRRQRQENRTGAVAVAAADARTNRVGGNNVATCATETDLIKQVIKVDAGYL